MATGKDNSFPIPPGETLKEVMAEKIHEDIADVLDYKKDITPSLAIALEGLLGVDRSFWLTLQENYNQECNTLPQPVIQEGERYGFSK